MLTQLCTWAIPKFNTVFFNTEPYSLTASFWAHKTSLSQFMQNEAQSNSLQSIIAIITIN